MLDSMMVDGNAEVRPFTRTIVLTVLCNVQLLQAHPPYLEDYEVKIIRNCVPTCHKTDGPCTIYDPQYEACDEILSNVRHCFRYKVSWTMDNIH